jgi:hypothetical protein
MEQYRVQAEAELRGAVGRCLRSFLAQQNRVNTSHSDDERILHEMTLTEIGHSYWILSRLWEDSLRHLDH